MHELEGFEDWINSDLYVVSITAPTTSHKKTVAAFPGKKDVLMEKPIVRMTALFEYLLTISQLNPPCTRDRR